MENKNIIIYTASDGRVQLEVRLENDSVWLTQRQIADLLGTEVPAISKHISNIYESGEFDRAGTLSKMEIVRIEGKRKVSRELEHFNLDMVISVGYRVNSLRGTQFRVWANGVLKEFLIKGYAINEKRLREERGCLSHALERTAEILVRETRARAAS
jgi:hypothetical protein